MKVGEDKGESITLSTLDDIALADELKWMGNQLVIVRYWISDRPSTKDQVCEDYLQFLYGNSECIYVHRYSEITGHYGTDEEINIGGHNLISELKCEVGNFLILEIDHTEIFEVDRD